MRTVRLRDAIDFDTWRTAARALATEGVPPEDVVWQVEGEGEDLFASAPFPLDGGRWPREAGSDGGAPAIGSGAPPQAPETAEGVAPPPGPPGQLPPSRGKGTELPSSPTRYGRDDGSKAATPAFTVPRAFIDLAQYVVCHSDPERFALLYRLLWRLRTERGLLDIAVDPDVARAEALSKSVRRDVHKMRAYVRFREITDEQGPLHVAWFEPEHHIVELNAPFFVRRFAGMRWAILTPERSARWDGEHLTFGPGAAKAEAPEADAMEEVWRGYYASIFNPARLKLKAMQGHMPQKYWRNLPEAELIVPLVKEAARRTETMVAEAPSEPAKRRMRAAPEHADEAHRYGAPVASTGHNGLDALRAQAADCRACPLWEPATQTVFGEGPASARVMFVGEQPGDQEDLAGRPFVGPAGGVFDRALAEAGVDRTQVYVTNAVKHFKFEPRGKFRLHQKPTGAEIKICNKWLQNEIEIIEPELIVALGATAAQALFGKAVTIGKVRGVFQPVNDNQQILVTVHPSFLLRLPDEQRKREEYARFVEDLRLVAPKVAA
jgi:uracil-DNA glycosylase